jgi:ribosomal protein S21
MIRSPIKNGGAEAALRALKRLMQVAGILKMAKEKKCFVKKSAKRRLKRIERERRIMKVHRAQAESHNVRSY